MRPMRTAVISDLHLGALSGYDVAREGEERERLIAAISGADRLVLLGDMVELRERPLAASARGRPAGVRGARASARRPPGRCSCRGTTTTPSPSPGSPACGWMLTRSRPRRSGRLAPTTEPSAGSPGWMPDVELTHRLPRTPPARRRLRHPRPLPRPASDDSAPGVDRGVRDGARSRAAARERARPRTTRRSWRRSTPSTSGLAQGASAASLSRGGSVSRDVWRRASSNGRPGIGRFLLGRVTIPGAVAALNGLGLGPFRATLTGEELRRAGLLAMARVAEVLAPRRPARDLRPHPPAWPAAGRRASGVDDALRHAALEHRQLALRERLPHARPGEPLLAGHRADPRGRAARRSIENVLAGASR